MITRDVVLFVLYSDSWFSPSKSEEKISDMIDNNIVCLANGFSDSGI